MDAEIKDSMTETQMSKDEPEKPVSENKPR